MQPPGTVIEHELENRARPLPIGFQPERDDPTTGRGGRPRLQLANAKEMSPVFVTSGSVQEKIAHGVQVQPGQLGETFRPHPLDRVQGGGQWVAGCSLHAKILPLVQAFVSSSVVLHYVQFVHSVTWLENIHCVRTAAGSKACFAFTEATALCDEIQS
jgi:hypothetical protein